MLKEALQYLEELGGNRIQVVHGNQAYLNGELLASPAALATPLEFSSLKGLVAYLDSSHDEASISGSLALMVDGPEQVRLIGELNDGFRQREVLAIAEPYLSTQFELGRFLDIETFVTKIQSLFVQDKSTELVLKVVGNIKGEQVQTLADDGVSQQVSARAGIARVENVVVPNPVTLRPFRTFPEVEQPISKYVLRMRQNDGGSPSAALFEVGDCQWKHEAVTKIAQRLAEMLDLAGNKVPVFA